MTTSDHYGEIRDPELDSAAGFVTAQAPEAETPESDALEQRVPAMAADEPIEELPELPDDVDPADALDQARAVGGQDDLL